MIKRASKQLVVLALILSLVTPFYNPPKAEAQMATFDAAVFGLVQALLAEETVHNETIKWKEFVGDTIFYLLNEVVIESLSASIVNWINSGFDGNPAFVSDLERHLKNAEADVFGNFLDELDLGYMCSSFDSALKTSLSLELALLEGDNDIGSKTYKSGASCTVDEALANVGSSAEEFVNDFHQGGWGAWLHITQPKNNQYGAYLSVRNEALRRRAEAAEKETGDINRGSGFLSWSEEGACIEWGFDYVDDPDAGIGAEGGLEEDRVCTKRAPDQVLTPGSVIEQQLNQTLGSGQRKLEVADEINEIVSALLSQLLNQVLGPDGLFGASQKDSDGTSYTDELGNNEADLENVLDDFLDQAEDVIDILENYIPIAASMVGRIEISNDELFELRECYERGEERGQDNSAQISEVENDIRQNITRAIDINEDILEARILIQELETIIATNGEGLTLADISELSQRANRASRRLNPQEAASDLERLREDHDQMDSETRSKLRFCQIRNGERRF